MSLFFVGPFTLEFVKGQAATKRSAIALFELNNWRSEVATRTGDLPNRSACFVGLIAPVATKRVASDTRIGRKEQ